MSDVDGAQRICTAEGCSSGREDRLWIDEGAGKEAKRPPGTLVAGHGQCCAVVDISLLWSRTSKNCGTRTC